MLVDVDATLEEAGDIAQAVLAQFAKSGVIVGDANSDCVLGGKGYRPGAMVAEWYSLNEHEIPFWEGTTCGVEPHVGRGFNAWALGPVFEGFTCPSCDGRIKRLEGTFWDAIVNAIGEWMQQSGCAG